MVERNKDGLTPAEERVYKLVIQGLSNAEIGERLGLSVGGVKFQMTSILRKYKVKRRTVLMAMAAKRRK